MRILVTGGTGQLGQALRGTLDEGDHLHEARYTVRREPEGEAELAMELTQPTTITRAVDEADPDWVIHTAATTDVDACERDPETARQVNETGTRHLAQATREAGARLLYVSTDYVFDGEHGPYSEDDEPDPINAYGRSKLAGERAVQDVLGDEALVARTCVVVGPHRSNFVTWVIDRLRSGEPVPAIEDQSVTPTYAPSLAEQLLTLVEADEAGLWHTAGPDELTRLEMAQTIADTLDLDADLIEPTKRSELGWEADRPRRAGLETNRSLPSLHTSSFSKTVEQLAARRS